jgi:aryl-alcohol dehydrogenase-like predicted oxidoreductase
MTPDEVINETIPTLKQLRQQGKLRYIGRQYNNKTAINGNLVLLICVCHALVKASVDSHSQQFGD